jgi:hypothetical protein
VRRRFVTYTGHQLFGYDKLCLRPSGGAQVLQYGEAIFISPIMENLAEEEDGDVLLLQRLRCEEVVGLAIKDQMSGQGRCKRKMTNFGALRGQIRVPQACSSSKTVAACPIFYQVHTIFGE